MMNDGKYNGGQILKPETVEMMFNNQLDGFSIEWGILGRYGGFFDESDLFGLAWAIENSDDEYVRNKGAVYWAGSANTYFTLDKDKGVALVYFTQFFPLNDKVSYEFYRLFKRLFTLV